MSSFNDDVNWQFNPSLEKTLPQQWQQAGGQQLQAPPLPPRKNTLGRQYRPLRLRTHDWGMKNQTGWSKFNRSVYYGTPEFERKRSSIPSAPSAAGLQTRSRAWNSRRINFRSHNWGSRTQNGWSGFNNWKYQPQNLSQWEPKSTILEELRSQNRSRGLTAAPLAVAASAIPSTIVPVNMLPPPINDGSKYEHIIGVGRRSNKYRKNLKQPLNTFATSQVALADLPAQQPRKLSRRDRKALRNQNNGLNGISAPVPLTSTYASSNLTRLGTSATSGVNGLPVSNNSSTSSRNTNKLSRKQKRALRKNSKLQPAFLGANTLPANIPVNNTLPVTNVISSPILSSAPFAAAPIAAVPLVASPLAAAPLGSTFIKTAPVQTLPTYAVGRSAF